MARPPKSVHFFRWMPKCCVCEKRVKRAVCVQCVQTRVARYRGELALLREQNAPAEAAAAAYLEARTPTSRVLVQRALCAARLRELRHRLMAVEAETQERRRRLTDQCEVNRQRRQLVERKKLWLARTLDPPGASSSSSSSQRAPPPGLVQLHTTRARLLKTIQYFLRPPSAAGPGAQSFLWGDINVTALTGVPAASPEELHTALGLLALFVAKAADLLEVPLPFPLHPCGSSSHVASPRRLYPLYLPERLGPTAPIAPFREGLRALNADIRQLCHAHGLRVDGPDTKQLHLSALDLLCTWPRLIDATQPVANWVTHTPGTAPTPTSPSLPPSSPGGGTRAIRPLLPRMEELLVALPSLTPPSRVSRSASTAAAAIPRSVTSPALTLGRRLSVGPPSFFTPGATSSPLTYPLSHLPPTTSPLSNPSPAPRPEPAPPESPPETGDQKDADDGFVLV